MTNEIKTEKEKQMKILESITTNEIDKCYFGGMGRDPLSLLLVVLPV